MMDPGEGGGGHSGGVVVVESYPVGRGTSALADNDESVSSESVGATHWRHAAAVVC